MFGISNSSNWFAVDACPPFSANNHKKSSQTNFLLIKKNSYKYSQRGSFWFRYVRVMGSRKRPNHPSSSSSSSPSGDVAISGKRFWFFFFVIIYIGVYVKFCFLIWNIDLFSSLLRFVNFRFWGLLGEFAVKT